MGLPSAAYAVCLRGQVFAYVSVGECDRARVKVKVRVRVRVKF